MLRYSATSNVLISASFRGLASGSLDGLIGLVRSVDLVDHGHTGRRVWQGPVVTTLKTQLFQSGANQVRKSVYCDPGFATDMTKDS